MHFYINVYSVNYKEENEKLLTWLKCFTFYNVHCVIYDMAKFLTYYLTIFCSIQSLCFVTDRAAQLEKTKNIKKVLHANKTKYCIF